MRSFPVARCALAVVLVGVLASCSDGGRSLEAFCDQLDVMQEADVSFGQIDLDDSVAVHESLSEFSDHFERLAEVAPDDISEQTAAVARFGVALAEAALNANPDDPFDRAQQRAFSRGVFEGTPANLNEAVMVVGDDLVVYEVVDAPRRVSTHGIEERIRLAAEALRSVSP